MTTTTNTIKIGRTNYTIESVDASNTTYIDMTAHIVGPRGGIKSIVVFDNGCVRVINYSNQCIPTTHRDIWGEEADAIVEALRAA